MRDELIRIKLHTKQSLKEETTKKSEESSEEESALFAPSRRLSKLGTLNKNNMLFNRSTKPKTLKATEKDAAGQLSSARGGTNPE